MNQELPPAVRTVLWSYDVNKIDTKRDERLIIRQILNFGTLEAVRWMRAHYTEEIIREAFTSSAESEWSKKSLCYWKHILHTSPTYTTRTEKIA
jgi:hypothetical protein